jgi:hypothetical protein
MVLSAAGAAKPLDVTAAPPVLSQNSAVEGGGDLTLLVNGSGFASDATVQWNGAPLATSVVNPGQLQATVPAADLAEEGTATVTVASATKGSGTIAPQTFTIADAPLAAAPLAAMPVLQFEGSPSLNKVLARFTDADPGGTVTDYTANITWGDGTSSAGTVQVDPAGGFDVVGSHTYAEEGSYNTSVQIADAGGSTLSVTGSTTVADAALHATAPAAPLTGTENATTAPGSVLASFTDDNPAAAGDFTASINWGDGTSSAGTVVADGHGGFNVQGSHLYAEEGSYSASVQITDAGGSTATAAATVKIADAPLTAGSTPPVTVQEGDLGLPVIPLGSGKSLPHDVATLDTLTVAHFTDPGSDGTPADYTAMVNWGDGTSSPGIVVTNDAGGFDVRSSHAYADVGSYPLSVVITDAGGSSVTAANSATVTDAPLTAAGTPLTAKEGSALAGVVVANFTDANRLATAADYKVSINWGDGTTSTGTVVALPPPPVALGVPLPPLGFNVQGSHTYSEGGAYKVSVVITDDGGSSVTAAGTATITDAPLTAAGNSLGATEGQNFGGVLATFQDAKAGEPVGQYSATINWGDGTSSAGVIAALGTAGKYAVQGTHTYTVGGWYTVQVTIGDKGGAGAVAKSHIRVADAALTATGNTVLATEGHSFTLTLATFTDANPLARAADFKAIIFWGDGNSDYATITPDKSKAGTFDVTGSHLYIEEGAYPIKVQIRDAAGGGASVSGTINVADAPLAAVFKPTSGFEGNAVTGVLATFTDGDPWGVKGDYKATINWGDGTSSAGTLKENVFGAWNVSGTHTYNVEKGYKVSVTITDKGGASTTVSDTVTIADAPLFATGRAVKAVEGTSFTGVVATFDDAYPFGVAGNYSATINWDDGTSSAGTIVANGDGFDVMGTHTYAREGVHKVTVKIKDVDGSTATATGTARVADAPLTALGSSITASEGIALMATVATFTDGNPAAPASNFTAMIRWGDGSSSPGTVLAKGGGKFAVQGTHTYAREGSYAVTVKVQDQGGSKASAGTTINIQDAALAAHGVSFMAMLDRPYAGVVATFTDADGFSKAGTFSATIDWGNGKTSAATIKADPSGGFDVVGNNTYLTSGNFNVTVTIKDIDGSTAVAHSSAHVLMILGKAS